MGWYGFDIIGRSMCQNLCPMTYNLRSNGVKSWGLYYDPHKIVIAKAGNTCSSRAVFALSSDYHSST